MPIDPVYAAALRRTSRLSIDLEAQLLSKLKSEPLLVVLHTAKEQAAEALAALVDVDAEDPKAIRALQNEVTRFDDMVRWLKQMLIDGPEADRELGALQMQEARELILSDEDAAQLGIPTEGTHDD
ncbi:hypothetical protein [Bradyrhizobium sp. sGM-13]|uniref:hypothetical protein n=1 Tax=Bradyrhizobium sp. sGM-13 TaxID=2831781 RepID=UPI001BCD0B49|nr:hypothetical protein [Bradyrhizobium sp. sGM-13]